MSKVFYRKKFSDYLGEQRAILDIYAENIPDPSPTPTPSPQPVSPTRTPTPTPTPSITPTITPTASVTPTITPTNTVTPTQTKSPTPTRTVTPTVTPTNTPSPTPDVLYDSSVVVESCDGNLYTGGIDVFINGTPYNILPDGTTTGTTGCIPYYIGNGDSFIYQIQYAGSYTGCTSPGFVWNEIRYISFSYNAGILPIGGYDYLEAKYQNGVLVSGPTPRQAAIGVQSSGCTTTPVNQWIDLAPLFYIQGGPAPTATPTVTPTNTTTPTVTPTPTPTPTSTVTPTVTSTPTVTPTQSSGPAFDADAAVYLSAVVSAGGTTNATISAATNTLFTSLKSAGLYTKIDIMYPYIGGVANSNKINAKLPGTYDITFNGTYTHNYSGSTSNSSSLASTNYVAVSPTDNLNSHHYSLYIGTTGATYAGGAVYIMEFGNIDTLFNGNFLGVLLGVEYNVDGGQTYFGNLTGGLKVIDKTTMGTSLGFIGASRETSTSWFLNKNGSNIATDTNTRTQVFPSNALGNPTYIPAFAGNIVSGQRRHQFTTFGEGLTSAEMNQLQTIINTFQTTLGRNTY